MRGSKNRGFTLTELLAALALAAVLAAVALPDLHAMVVDARLRATADALRDSLEYAREQALIRRSAIALCRSDETGAELPRCAQGSSWSDGWLVFLDPDGNAAPDQASDVLQVHGAINPQLRIGATRSIRKKVRFRADGTSPASAGHFTICDRQAEHAAHRVLLSFGGRVRLPLARTGCQSS